MRTPIIVAALALIAAALPAAGQEPGFYDCQNRAVRIDIPSMPLGSAVGEFTEITRCPVSIDADEVANTNVRDVPSAAVRGKMTPSKALKAMLLTSPLKSRSIKGGFSIYAQ